MSDVVLVEDSSVLAQEHDDEVIVETATEVHVLTAAEVQVLAEQVEDQEIAEVVEIVEIVTASEQGPPGPPGPPGDSAAVFITDVAPSGGGIVGSKQYAAGTVPQNVDLLAAVSDTPAVRVHIGCSGGSSSYSPQVTINGVAATLHETSTKRWFAGHADILLADGDNQVVAETSAGSVDTCIVTLSGAGPDVLGVTFGPYPAGQTELKAGDSILMTVAVPEAAASVQVLSHGASATTALWSVVDGKASGLVIIGAASGAQAVSVKACNALGTFGAEYVSAPLALNQTYPSIAQPSVAYPGAQMALNAGESATVTAVAANFDTISYQSADLAIEDASTYAPAKAVTNARTGYVGAGQNYTITAHRIANGATTVVSGLVKIATVVPSAVITIVPAGRLSSSPVGTDYEVRITPSQSLLQPPALSASHGVWQGSWVLVGAYWKRTLRITDAVPRGQAAFSALQLVGLSGIAGDAITAGAQYVVGGFSQRIVTFPAYSRVALIGVAVADPAKTSAQLVGGAALMRYADNAVRQNGYYIADADGSYNPNGLYLGLSDAAFAGANTTGTLQVSVQEVA